jgi:hypothetical protein
LKDAEAVKELLLKKGSFKEGEVTLVRNPTKEELQKALTEFEESIKEHEGQCVAILYYAGKQGGAATRRLLGGWYICLIVSSSLLAVCRSRDMVRRYRGSLHDPHRLQTAQGW